MKVAAASLGHGGCATSLPTSEPEELKRLNKARARGPDAAPSPQGVPQPGHAGP